jgi:tryptophanase
MNGSPRALLFTIVLSILGAGVLIAQRGGAVARAPFPSSTALGAGALSTHPSSTALASAPSFRSPGFSNGRSGFAGNRGFSNTNTRTRREYRQLPLGYVAAPYYYPFYDWGGDYSGPAQPSDDYGYGPDPATDAMLRNQAALGAQVQRLTAQLNDLMYGQGYQQQTAAPQEQAAPSIPITLVLRSGEQLRVQNYAITGNMFWDFTQTGARKIPLSSIDIAASTKASQASGAEFPQLDGTQ